MYNIPQYTAQHKSEQSTWSCPAKLPVSRGIKNELWPSNCQWLFENILVALYQYGRAIRMPYGAKNRAAIYHGIVS